MFSVKIRFSLSSQCWFFRPDALMRGIIILPSTYKNIYLKLPEEAGKLLFSKLAKCLSVHEVDDEVNTGVADQRQVVETGQTEDPVRGLEQVRPTPLHLWRRHQLVAVEDDPGEVATAEHTHDAGGDQGAVDLAHHTLPAAAVGKSV